MTAIAAIGTDRRRLDSYTYNLAVNQATLYAGYDWRFRHFRKTYGYANLPLDGLWLRAPYLHNGSVPNVRDLLEPAANRAGIFYRGNDVFDPVRLGFVADVPTNGDIAASASTPSWPATATPATRARPTAPSSRPPTRRRWSSSSRPFE